MSIMFWGSTARERFLRSTQQDDKTVKSRTSRLSMKVVLASCVLVSVLLFSSVRAFSSSSSSRHIGLLRSTCYRTKQRCHQYHPENHPAHGIVLYSQLDSQQQQEQVLQGYSDDDDDENINDDFQTTTKVLVAAMDEWKWNMLHNEEEDDFATNGDDIASSPNLPRNWANVQAWSRRHRHRRQELSLGTAPASSTTTVTTISSVQNHSGQGNQENTRRRLPRNWALLQDFVTATTSQMMMTTPRPREASSSSSTSHASSSSSPPAASAVADVTLLQNHHDSIFEPDDRGIIKIDTGLAEAASSSSSSSSSSSLPNLQATAAFVAPEHVVAPPPTKPDDDDDDVTASMESSTAEIAALSLSLSLSTTDEEMNAVGVAVAAALLGWSLFLDDELSWQRALLAASAASYFVPGPVGNLARAVGTVLQQAAIQAWQDQKKKNYNDLLDDDDAASKSVEPVLSFSDESLVVVDETGLLHRPAVAEVAVPLFFAASKDIVDTPDEAQSVGNIWTARKETLETASYTAATATTLDTTMESTNFVPAATTVPVTADADQPKRDDRLTLQSQTTTTPIDDEPNQALDVLDSKVPTAPATKSQFDKDVSMPTLVANMESSTAQTRAFLDKLNELKHRSLLAYRLSPQARERATRRVDASSMDKMGQVTPPAVSPTTTKRSRPVQGITPLFFATTLSRQPANVAGSLGDKFKSRRKAPDRDETVIGPLGVRTRAPLETGASTNGSSVQQQSAVPTARATRSRTSKSGAVNVAIAVPLVSPIETRKVVELNDSTAMTAKEMGTNDKSTALKSVAVEKENELNRRALLAYRLTLEVNEQKQRATVQSATESIKTILSGAALSVAAQLEQIYSILKACPIDPDTKQVGEAAKLVKINAILVARKATMINTKVASEAQREQISSILAPRTAYRGVVAPSSLVPQDVQKEASSSTRESLEETNLQTELTRRSLLKYRLELQALERAHRIKEREALEASIQSELLQRTLLHYRLTLQADERVQRAKTKAQEESKRNELTMRSMFGYSMQLQADERTRRALAQAFEESKRKEMEISRQHEWIRRTILEYRLKLQADERTQRAIIDALEASKQKELTMRSMLGYRMQLQTDERTQRALAHAVEESKRKETETSRRHELTRRTILEYRMKLQADERAQRAINDALEASKRNELTNRSLLSYHLKLQGDERTRRAIAEALEVSNQKALEASKQSESTRRTILEYRMKLQADERTQRAIIDALEASKQKELKHRSLLSYQLKLQGGDRTRRAIAKVVEVSNEKALEASKQNELTRRSLLAYQVKLQAEERAQRYIAEAAKASKKNELARRSLLEHRLRLQADERNQRSAATLEASKQKARLVSSRNETVRRSILAYQLKRRCEEQTQRALAQALEESKRNELARRSVLKYRLKLQANDQAKSSNAAEVPTATIAPKAQSAKQTAPSTLTDAQQKQEPVKVETVVTGKDEERGDDSMRSHLPDRSEARQGSVEATSLGNDIQRAEAKKPVVPVSLTKGMSQNGVGASGGSARKKTITSMSWERKPHNTSFGTPKNGSTADRGPGKDAIQKDGVAVQSSSKAVASDVSQGQRAVTNDRPSKQNIDDSSDQGKRVDDEAQTPVVVVAAKDDPKSTVKLSDSNQDKAMSTIDLSPRIPAAALPDENFKNQGDGQGVVAPQKEPKIYSNTKVTPQQEVAAQDYHIRNSPQRTPTTTWPSNNSKQGESFERPSGEDMAQKVQTSTPATATAAGNMDPEQRLVNLVQEKPQQQQEPPLATLKTPNGAAAEMMNTRSSQSKLTSEPITGALVATQQDIDSMRGSQRDAVQPPPTGSKQGQTTRESPTKPTTTNPVESIPQQAQTSIPTMSTVVGKMDPNQYRRVPSTPIQQQPQSQQQQAHKGAATKLYGPNDSAPTTSESMSPGKPASEHSKRHTETVVAAPNGGSASRSPTQRSNEPLANGSTQVNLAAQSSYKSQSSTRPVQDILPSTKTATSTTTAWTPMGGPKQENFNRAIAQPKQPPTTPAQPTATERWSTFPTRRKRRATPSMEGSTSRILQQQQLQPAQPKTPLPPPPSAFTGAATRRTPNRAMRLDTFDDDWKNLVGVNPMQRQLQQQQQQQQQQRNRLSSQTFASLSGGSGNAAPLAAAEIRSIQPNSIGGSISSINGIDKKDPLETKPPSSPAGAAAPSTPEQVTVRTSSSSSSPTPTSQTTATAATPPPPPPQQQPQRVRQQQQQAQRYQNRWWDI